jgi:adenylate cyclase
MMQGDTLPSFGGEHREITAIFTDIAGFTTTAETLDAATVAGLLGDYFSVLTDAVVKNGGLVNDYIGDGLVVLFGAPMHQPDHADRAVAAALAMDEAGQPSVPGLRRVASSGAVPESACTPAWRWSAISAPAAS